MENSIFLWVLFIFTVQRQGLWRGLCSVCVQARTKSVFMSYARDRKSWKSCFPMSVVHLYCPMARPVERVLLWTPPEVSVSFHRFSIYFQSLFYIFSLIFLIFSLISLCIFIDFLYIFIDFLNSSILFLTPPQGPSKFHQKSGATSLVKSLLKKWSIVAENLFSCPTHQNALLGLMLKSCFFRWIPKTWSLQLGEYPGRLVMSGQSW